MKKTVLLIAALGCVATVNAAAPGGERLDTLRTYALQNVQVVSTRAGKKTPVAYSDMSKSQIRMMNQGKDMPWILNFTPSVTTSSDAGIGIGYTAIHVRGTDPTRINITANGIPVNDAESGQLYWVNMADLASSLESIQIQRGVGTSTNGAGAFGATVNMQTENISQNAYGRIDLSGGSYGTHKETFSFSTGLLGGHWGFQGRLSNIGSDGFIDRASSKLNSYFLQGGYFADNTVVKFITFNGTEKTYMAWDYASKADMEKYGRSYNPSGIYTDKNGNVAFYKNQTDNYHQQNYQLLWNQRWSSNWNTNVAFHYTRGDGYYEQMKEDQKLYKYLMTTNTDLMANLVRQKKMLNDFYGFIASANYDNHNGLTATIGGGWNKYDGDHFGKVLWSGSPYIWLEDGMQVYYNDGVIFNPDHEYYRNNAKKTDGNIYGKINYEFLPGLSAYVDLQYRHISYKMDGTSQEFDDDHNQRPLVLDRKYDFFNPKFGLVYNITPEHTVYASYAIAHKEPTRNDFEDMMAETDAVDPQAERLNDLEVGYKYQSGIFNAGVNFYYMDYDNQFVLTGAQDSNGEMVARNIKDSYRMGVELMAGLRPFKGFEWNINATLSKNRAKNMNVTVINEDWSQSYANVGTTKLAYSPDVILNNIFTYEYKGLRASLMSKYVSEQNMTNSGFKKYLNTDGKTYTSAVIDAMFVSDLDLSYTFKMKGLKSATVGVTVYNLFNEEYESNGSCSMNFKNENGKIVAYDGGWAWSTYSAQAPTHFIAHLSITF